VWVLVVVGAVLLGYVFNLLRLCLLVLYYIVALASSRGCRLAPRWATT
jgi:hypothetical protein